MRKLILFMHMSLDGYVAAANRTSGLTTADFGAADDDNADDDGGRF